MLIFFLLIVLRITEACMSSCEAVHAYCSTVFKFTGKTELLPDCAAATTITKSPLQDEGSCNHVPTQRNYDTHIKYTRI